MRKYLLLIGIVSSAGLFAACTHQQTTTTVQDTTSSVVNETESELDQLTDENIILAPVNNSGQAGDATIQATEDGKTQVVLTMQGGTFTQAQPAHIHEGDCPGVGKIVYTLNPVQEGFSTTILEVDIDELEGKNLAINVHESTANIDRYTACGQLDD